MPNPYFRFKQFTVFQDRCAMKVSTDACIFGAWMAGILKDRVPVDGRILDIGTGTGLLTLMIAQQSPAFITGVDIQETDVRQAAANMAASPWSDRLRALPGDINDLTFSHAFDAIVVNPPFFENDLQGPTPNRNLARHGDTLTFTQLLKILSRDLTPTGLAGVLIPDHRLEAFLKEAQANDLHPKEVVHLHPTSTHPPFRSMIWLQRQKPGDPILQNWIIRHGEAYGPECHELLKDYYLYL